MTSDPKRTVMFTEEAEIRTSMNSQARSPNHADRRPSFRRGSPPEERLMSKHLSYWNYDKNAPLSCPSCGWRGRGAGNEELHSQLLDVTCPDCDEMLLIVSFPTRRQTRTAAAVGNPRAERELTSATEREERVNRAAKLELREPSQLPELAAPEVLIDWDVEEPDDDPWVILRHQGAEIWREVAFYEGYERFAAIFKILKRRYGARLVEVRPTAAAKFYLSGDSLAAPKLVGDLNASLKGGEPS